MNSGIKTRKFQNFHLKKLALSFGKFSFVCNSNGSGLFSEYTKRIATKSDGMKVNVVYYDFEVIEWPSGFWFSN